jgi:F-type H+-transporting ATPase subunit b
MNLFDFNVPEQILVALSLLILVIVVRKFFWKPMMKMIEDRQKGVDDLLADAEDAKSQIAKMEEERQSQKAQLDQLIADKTNQARDDAKAETDRIISEAQSKAREIISSAEQQSKREHDQAVADSKKEIAALAISAAQTVVGSNMDNDKNRALIDSILNEQGEQNGS